MDQEGKLWSVFLDLVTVPDGRSNTIVVAFKGVLQKKNFPTHKLFGLGTYGAAVMTHQKIYLHTWILTSRLYYVIQICIYSIKAEQHTGVAKQLQDEFPWMVSVACKDASSTVPYRDTFNEHLQQLQIYFKNSCNRTAVLQAASKA